jgi:hypothetical protein
MRGELDCDECEEFFEKTGFPPPCDTCSKTELLSCNIFAWETWGVLNQFDRPMQVGMGGAIKMHIPYLTMAQVVEYRGGSARDLEKVMLIEKSMLPVIWEVEKKNNGGS